MSWISGRRGWRLGSRLEDLRVEGDAGRILPDWRFRPAVLYVEGIDMKDCVEKMFEEPMGCSEAQDVIRSISRFDYMARDEAVKRYSFAVPCSEAVRALVKLSPLVEVGAGGGYWAGILKKAGADVIATDIGKQSGYSRLWSAESVLRMSAVEAVKAYPDRNVFVCWPSYDECWAADMANAILPGRVLAYIGEGCGGCTANDRFFDILEEKYEEVEQLGIPQWGGIHDFLDIFRRKKK